MRLCVAVNPTSDAHVSGGFFSDEFPPRLSVLIEGLMSTLDYTSSRPTCVTGMGSDGRSNLGKILSHLKSVEISRYDLHTICLVADALNVAG